MYPELQATFKVTNSSNATNYGGDKETIAVFNCVALDGQEQENIISCRFYMGRSSSASRVYCSIWIHNKDWRISLSGKGWAGGYGYDKKSAALGEALSSAGVTLSRSIKGTGEVREAIIAVAKALGYEKFIVIEN